MTRFAVPEAATATKRLSPYVMANHWLSTADAPMVQLMPSGLVITRFPMPSTDTAANCPPPNVTAGKVLATGVLRVVHENPSELVITRLVPLAATAT